jgi:predicted hotdog family 3-hydroxylacyl-ACP dehydratase
MADYIPDIMTLLPQGPPFVMVDRLLGANGETARTSYRVKADNPLVEKGRFTVAGLIENMAQTAAAGAGYTAHAARAGQAADTVNSAPVNPAQPVRTGFIVSIKDLEINDLPLVGDELLTEITITGQVADIVVISGRVTCKNDIIATGEMKIIIIPE